MDKHQEFHWTSFCFLVAFKTRVLFCVCLDVQDHQQHQPHLYIYTMQPESWLESIWANLHRRARLWLVYGTYLPCHRTLSNSSCQVDKEVQSNQFNLISVLERKFVPRFMSYLTLLLLNTKTHCWLICLSLSNSGNLKSHMVTTWLLRQPVRVLTSLVPPSSLVTTHFGNTADLLIIETFEPESRSTRKSLWLCTLPIVSAVQMVMGDLVLESWFLVHDNSINVHWSQFHSNELQKWWWHS